ncbi:MAG: recombinase family protein [Pedosphaera sp.]|nr:recombinase family protein [Pedosphaera sp.]
MKPAAEQSSPPEGSVPVAVYTRVSTDNQVGGRFDSCDSQLAICQDHIRKCAALGWAEVAHYSDPAVSGSSMDRPALRSLMRHIEAGGVKVILIFKLERMSRNVDEFGPFRSFLKKHGCRLESATEDISETTPSGRLKNNLMLSFSQYERENTAEKTQVKMLQQAKRGYWNGGAVPFGYAYDKNTQSLQPHPEEAAVVRRVFEETAKLVSLEKIADALNREGLRTRSRIYRSKEGGERVVGVKRFRSDGLRVMVANPIFRGIIRYAGQEYQGRHEPIVSERLWEEANAAVVKCVPRAPAMKLDQDKHFHLLKGLVHCGCCNRALVPHASGNRDESGGYYRYYYCSNLVKERADARCTVRRLAAGSLESAVVQFLSQLGRHPDVIAASVGSSQSRRGVRIEGIKTELKEVDRELSEVSGRIRNCVEAITGGGKQIATELASEIAILKDRKQEHLVKRERMNQELAACEGGVLDEARVRQAVEHFGQILQGLTPNEQKTLVGLFLERIEVYPSPGAEPSASSAAVRRMELRLKLNVPRLVEGMEERMVVDGVGKPLLQSGMMITVQVALGQQGRSNQARVLSPFRCGEEVAAPAPIRGPATQVGKAQHPLVRARVWKRILTKDPKLSLRKLAERVGEVAPTLVHYFKLLKLAPEIQDALVRLRDPRAVYFFSIRRLNSLASMDESEQRRLFRHMQAEYAAQAVPVPASTSVAVRPAVPAKGMRIT